MRNTLLLFALLMVFGCTNNNRDNLFNGVIDDTHLGKGCNYGSSIADARELCDVYRGNKFSSNNNAEIALNKILSVTGMSKRFVLQECTDISNCVATSYKGIRYILYDSKFMDIIANNSNAWSRLAILAHEVGHHVNGHSLDLIVYASDAAKTPTLKESRQMEIEADEYSGFIMYKLGASLEQAQEAVKLISSNADDSYSTHPSQRKRLLAIERGYNQAKNQDKSNKTVQKNNNKPEKVINKKRKKKPFFKKGDMTAEDYFYQAKDRARSDKYYSYIIDKEFLDLWGMEEPEGMSRMYSLSKEFKEIQDKNYDDFSKAISLNPNYTEAYIERAIIRWNKGGQVIRAIKDVTKAIKLDPNNFDAYYLRSNFWSVVEGQEKAIIKDLNKLIKLKPEYEARFRFNRSATYGNLGLHRKAIDDATFVINSGESPSEQRQEYWFRAQAKDALGMESCDDWEKACEYGKFENGDWICEEYYKKCY